MCKYSYIQGLRELLVVKSSTKRYDEWASEGEPK